MEGGGDKAEGGKSKASAKSKAAGAKAGAKSKAGGKKSKTVEATTKEVKMPKKTIDKSKAACGKNKEDIRLPQGDVLQGHAVKVIDHKDQLGESACCRCIVSRYVTPFSVRFPRVRWQSLGFHCWGPNRFSHLLIAACPQEHLKPSEARLESKRAFLKRKDMKDDLEVSGGLLSHICNISFPRAPTTTFCFLLGSVDAKGIVRVAGFHCPEWEKQNDLSLIDWREQRVKSLCQSKSHEVIGCCLVKPTGEATLSNADAAMARKHQLECNEAFVTAITGKDRKTRFFRLTAAGVAEAEIEVGETTMVELHAAV